MLAAPRTCLVCATPLNFHQANSVSVCHSVQCRSVYNRLPADKTCAICGRLRSLTDLPRKVCTTPECNLRWVQQRREQEERQRAVIVAAAERLRESKGEAARIPLAVIPAFTGSLTNLPARRQRAFRDHLLRIIGAATARPTPNKPEEPLPVDTPEATAVLGQACALCKGFCCTGGGNHGYLTADTIRRYRQLHGEARPRDVLAAYLSYMANRTYKDSCVYHGAQGCGLPSEMRSNTCRRHFCPEMHKVRKAMAESESPRRFFVAATPKAIQAAGIIDEGGTQHVVP